MTNDNLEGIMSRINWLENNGKYLEILFFLNGLVEEELNLLIEAYEGWAKKILSQKNIQFEATEFRNSSSRAMALGTKIKYLNIFLQDARLNQLSKDFITLRNTAVHNLMAQDLVKLEKEIKSNMNSFYELITILTKQHNLLLRKEIGKLNRTLKKQKI